MTDETYSTGFVKRRSTLKAAAFSAIQSLPRWRRTLEEAMNPKIHSILI
ncbi:MAG: hypothetical protein HKN87_13835 [Saprospiraceae bacterium]|nr:hypothetical protein [Saprospiraceae bacterium]